MSLSLLNAIKREDYELADQLIMNKRGFDETDRNGETPLMLLVCKREQHKVFHELFTKLIDAGADVNIKNDDGGTALINAMWCDRAIYTVRMLIDAGADVNIKSNGGWTALICAVCYNRQIYTVKMLIDAGADINIKGNYGRSALIYAAKKYEPYSHIDAVKMLIEADF